jgi:uncharacterized protein YceH (UPF0502 family)
VTDSNAQHVDDWHERNCAGKIPYMSRREAKHSAKRIQTKSGVKTDVYLCQFCGDFHVTSLSKFASRRAKQAVRSEIESTTEVP